MSSRKGLSLPLCPKRTSFTGHKSFQYYTCSLIDRAYLFLKICKESAPAAVSLASFLRVSRWCREIRGPLISWQWVGRWFPAALFPQVRANCASFKPPGKFNGFIDSTRLLWSWSLFLVVLSAGLRKCCGLYVLAASNFLQWQVFFVTWLRLTRHLDQGDKLRGFMQGHGEHGCDLLGIHSFLNH